MNDKNEVLIQVQDLKKAFGKLEVLRGISTEIPRSTSNFPNAFFL